MALLPHSICYICITWLSALCITHTLLFFLYTCLSYMQVEYSFMFQCSLWHTVIFSDSDTYCQCFWCACSKPPIASCPNHCHLSQRYPWSTTNATYSACYSLIWSTVSHSKKDLHSVNYVVAALSNYPFHPTHHLRSGRALSTDQLTATAHLHTATSLQLCHPLHRPIPIPFHHLYLLSRPIFSIMFGTLAFWVQGQDVHIPLILDGNCQPSALNEQHSKFITQSPIFHEVD